MGKYILPLVCVFLLALAGCGDSGTETAKKAEDKPEASVSSEETPAPTEENTVKEDEAPAQSSEASVPADSTVDAGPVATVNGITINRDIFESQVAMSVAEQMRFGVTDFDDPEKKDEANQAMRFMVLNNMVSLELACQEALRLGYAPQDEDLEAAVAEIKKGYETPEAFNELLSSYGETEDDLRQQLAKTMALKKWQDDNFLAEVAVSPEEAQTFYDQNQNMLRHGAAVRVSQIVLPVPLLAQPHEKEKIKARAELISQLLKAGEDFNYLAAEMSEDKDTAQYMGDLGWVEKGQNLAAMEQAIFNLKPGETSELVETPLGFYFFKVFEAREPGIVPFSEARKTIVDYISSQKMEMVLRDKMMELYEKADVQILDASLKQTYDEFMAESEQIEPNPENPPVGGDNNAATE